MDKKEAILRVLTPLEIMEYYARPCGYKRVNRAFSHPDSMSKGGQKTPSCYIKQRNGETYWIGNKDGTGGDCFSFVNTCFGGMLTFPEVLDRIISDFNILIDEVVA